MSEEKFSLENNVKNDVIKFPYNAKDFKANDDCWADDENIWLGTCADMVNSPAHYTRGKSEAIDVIEDAIEDAPSVKAGMLQAQVLKYMLRLWLKSNSKEDAKKARWYLNRLIDSLD